MIVGYRDRAVRQGVILGPSALARWSVHETHAPKSKKIADRLGPISLILGQAQVLDLYQQPPLQGFTIPGCDSLEMAPTTINGTPPT